ncbi:MAG: hypothetical protein ACI93R_001578 [Flavobacteriales bacterium]|jgi:hypothetical protein
MFLRPKALLVFSLLITLLSACGGNDNRGRGDETIADLKLTSITLNNGEISPVFDPTRTGPYSIDVAADVSEIEISAVIGDLPENKSILVFTRSASVGEITNISEVLSGEAASIPLTFGENIIFVKVISSEDRQSLEYILVVHREGGESRLVNIDLLSIDGAVTAFQFGSSFDDTFGADIVEFIGSVPFDVCTLGVRAFTRESHATMSINGRVAIHAVTTAVDLVFGENVIEVVVVSEDETATSTYTYRVTRDEPTETQLDDISYLESLVLSEGILVGAWDTPSTTGEGFACGVRDYVATVSLDVSTVELTLVPEESLVPIAIARRFDIENDGIFEGTEELALSDDGRANLNLVIGRNRFVVTVRPDETSFETYELEIDRTSTNLIIVSNGEELQDAMLNAEPSQHIFLTAGLYSAPAVEAESGLDGAHFYSDRSGAEDAGIVLRGSSGVNLTGDSLTTGSVLQLSGDYWTVAGLTLSGAKTGLILDSANNNSFVDILVQGVGGRGVEVRNDSNENAFRRLVVRETGQDETEVDVQAEAVVVGSDGSDWLDAPTPGAFSELNDGNVFNNVILGGDIAGNLFDVKEGSTNTLVQFGLFNSSDIESGDAVSAPLSLRGNSVDVRFNSFVHSTDNNIDSLIHVATAPDAWQVDNWGEGIRIFDNRISSPLLANLEMITASSDATVLSANNYSEDLSGELVSSDPQVDNSFTRPTYQVQSVEDEALCWTESRAVDVGLIETQDIVVLDACSNDDSQSWELNLVGNSEVQIFRAGTDRKITPRTNLGQNDLVLEGEDNALSPDDALTYRWNVVFFGKDEIQFLNRTRRTFAITNGQNNIYELGVGVRGILVNPNETQEPYRVSFVQEVIADVPQFEMTQLIVDDIAQYQALNMADELVSAPADNADPELTLQLDASGELIPYLVEVLDGDNNLIPVLIRNVFNTQKYRLIER